MPSVGDGGQGGSGNGGQGGKKRKLDAVPAPVADVSWTVCCLDGATFSAVVPEQARVAEIKRAIATLREVPCFTMELFVQDVEFLFRCLHIVQAVVTADDTIDIAEIAITHTLS